MSKAFVDWGCEDSIEHVLLGDGGVFGPRGAADFAISLDEKVVLVDVEVERWNPAEPGECVCIDWRLELDFGKNEVRLFTSWGKLLGREPFIFLGEVDLTSLGGLILKLEREKAPRVKFWRPDTPSASAGAPLEHFTEAG